MGTVVAAVSVIAGLSLSALLLCWFLWVYRLLSAKRESVMAARQQLQLHRDGLDQVRGSEREAAARRALESSRDICQSIRQSIRQSYSDALRRPLCRIPGYLMGFRPLP